MARSDSFQTKWASTPAQFERPLDTLIERGWAGGAAEDPPEAKWENWWHNRVDEAMAEIEANGAPTWFADVPYKVGAVAHSADKNWIARIANTGIEPGSVDDIGHWEELIIEKATQPETDAGTNDTKFITSLKLNNWVKQATETVMGLLKVASQAQVDEGADDTTAVTPKKLRWGVSYDLGQNGYVFLPSWLGGIGMQWQIASQASQGQFFTFPVSFPNACFIAVPIDEAPDAPTMNAMAVGPSSTSGVEIYGVRVSDGVTVTGGQFRIISLGH